MALSEQEEFELLSLEREKALAFQSQPKAQDPKPEMDVVSMAKKALAQSNPLLAIEDQLQKASPGTRELAFEAAGTGAGAAVGGPIGAGVGAAMGGAMADAANNPEKTIELGKKAGIIAKDLFLDPQNLVQDTAKLIESIGPEETKKFVGDRAVEGALGFLFSGGAKGIKGIGKAFMQTGEKKASAVSKELLKIGTRESTEKAGLQAAKGKAGTLLGQRKQEVARAANVPVEKAQEALKQLPAYQQEIIKNTDEAVLATKNAIGEAEKLAGVGLDKVGIKEFRRFIATPEKTAQFAEKFFDIANKHTPVDIAKSMSKKSIQIIRKAAENGAKKTTDEATRVQLFEVAKTFRNALGNSDRLISVANSNFKKAIAAKNSLPASLNETKKIIELGLKRAQNAAKEAQLSDKQIQSLSRTINILEDRITKIPVRFNKEKLPLELALRNAKEIAAKQATIRRWFGGIAAGAALTGIGIGVGSRLVAPPK